MKRIFTAALAIVSILMLSTACEEEMACQSAAEAPMRAGFYSIINDSVEIDTTIAVLNVIGVGQVDTVISGSNSVNIKLPLNPFTDSSAYFLVMDGVGDTLSVNYTRSLKLISEKCGFITSFDIQSIKTTYHHIDSVALMENKVDTENVQHVKIYL